MKRCTALALLSWGLAVSLSAQAVITRFAIADMDRILAAFTNQAAAKAFGEKRAQVQAEMEKHSQELRELTARLEEAREKKNNSQARALENEVRAKTQTAKDYIDAMTAELEKDREELQPKVTRTQIINAIRVVAEAEGCSVVISKGEGVIWSSPSVDITAKVIQRLQGRR